MRCVKIWSKGAPVPEGLFNKSECPEAPQNWFSEDAEHAAELFGLELGKSCLVNIQDETGKIKVFQIIISQQAKAFEIE